MGWKKLCCHHCRSEIKKMKSKIDDYMQKQDSPQKEICQRLRSLILRIFPDMKEEMKWGVPIFGDGKFYIVALKDHVNLGFSLRGLSEEEKAFFQGGGRTMKHIEITSLKDIDETKIVKLLEVAKDQ